MENHPCALAKRHQALGSHISALSWSFRAQVSSWFSSQTNATGQQGKHVAKSLAPFSLASEDFCSISASLGALLK